MESLRYRPSQVTFATPDSRTGFYKDVIFENPMSNDILAERDDESYSEYNNIYAVPCQTETASEYQHLDISTMRTGKISAKQEIRRQKEWKSKTMMRNLDDTITRQVYSTNVIISRRNSF